MKWLCGLYLTCGPQFAHHWFRERQFVNNDLRVGINNYLICMSATLFSFVTKRVYMFACLCAHLCARGFVETHALTYAVNRSLTLLQKYSYFYINSILIRILSAINQLVICIIYSQTFINTYIYTVCHVLHKMPKFCWIQRNITTTRTRKGIIYSNTNNVPNNIY